MQSKIIIVALRATWHELCKQIDSVLPKGTPIQVQFHEHGPRDDASKPLLFTEGLSDELASTLEEIINIERRLNDATDTTVRSQ
jgi:hypothetical protein